jgi:hypothetical protein
MIQAPPAQERRNRERTKPSHLADVLYDAFYSAAVGGAALGLFFLLVDSARGQPFFTPSLMGSVLFLGVAADAVTEVRLDMVAYFTMVHFALFGAVGLTLSILVHEVEVHSRHPRELIGALFVILEGGFLIGANLFMPGVVEAIGFGRIVIGNLVTAVAIALFLMRSHNPDGWNRLKAGKPFV